MAKPKPISRDKELHDSIRRAIALSKENPDVPAGELTHSAGTAVAEVYDELIAYVDSKDRQELDGRTASILARQANTEYLRKQVADKVKQLRKEKIHRRKWVGILCKIKLEDVFSKKRRTYSESWMQTALKALGFPPEPP